MIQELERKSIQQMCTIDELLLEIVDPESIKNENTGYVNAGKQFFSIIKDLINFILNKSPFA